MAFDYVTAARLAGVSPDMYESEAQLREDMLARAKGDVGFRRQLARARSAEQAEMARRQREAMFGMPTALPSMMWKDRQAQILQRLQAMNQGGR